MFCGSGTSSSSSSTTGAKSISGFYYPQEIATTTVTDDKGNTKNITKKIREGLTERGFKLNQLVTENNIYKDKYRVTDGSFYNEVVRPGGKPYARWFARDWPKYSNSDKRGPRGIQIH